MEKIRVVGNSGTGRTRRDLVDDARRVRRRAPARDEVHRVPRRREEASIRRARGHPPRRVDQLDQAEHLVVRLWRVGGTVPVHEDLPGAPKHASGLSSEPP